MDDCRQLLFDHSLHEFERMKLLVAFKRFLVELVK